MDPIAYLMMSKGTGSIMYDVILVIFLLPVITIFTEKLKNSIKKVIENYNLKPNTKSVELAGWENLINGAFSFDFPTPMLAVCYHLIKNNKVNNTRYFNKLMNGLSSHWDPIIHSKELHYIINNNQNIYYSEDIIINIDNESVSSNDKQSMFVWKISMTIKSNKDIDCITNFINKCISEYEQHLEFINKDKMYHFIYQGKDEKDDKYKWKISILSDLNDDTNKNFETFDTMFTPNKNQLINDINRLKDLDYYKKTGAKRKKGYLFYGPPGCGKTSSVIAMANYDKRHIIEIPMSRLKTNSDIEEILNISKIENVNFKKDEIILLFDEIDTGMDSLKKRDSEKLSEDIEKKQEDVKDTLIKSLVKKEEKIDSLLFDNKDKICLGSILSRLDGVGSYNGIIIVATTNCIDKLSPAIYRHGRLDPVYFDFMDKNEIKNMIENFYKYKLSVDQINELPTKNNKISPSSMRYYIENNIDSLDNLLEYLKKMIKK
jgi:hypothetical protein